MVRTMRSKPFIFISLIIILSLSVLFMISCTSGVDIGETMTYMLTVQDNGDGSTDPSGQVKVIHGKPLDVNAIPDDIFGYDNQFTTWSVIAGNVTFGNANAASTAVTLRNGDATIQANFLQTSLGASALTVTPENKKLTISWDSIPNTVIYTLHYTTDGTIPETSGIKTSIADVQSPYVLNVPENDKLYTIQVEATSSLDERLWTDYERAVPLTKTALMPNVFGLYRAVYLDWCKLESTNKFQVLRATDSLGPYTSISGQVSGNSFTDSSVNLYQKYYYKVIPSHDDGLALSESHARCAEPSPFGIVQHSRTGGSYTSDSGVAVQGSYAYVTYDTGSSWGLRIINILNPDQPSQAGSCTTTDDATMMEINGSYAYLASGQTFMIVSILNPSQPSEVGWCSISDTIMDIAVSGNYAFVATWDGGLKVVDVSTPGAPDLLETSSCNTGAKCTGVAIKGNYAFVSDTGGLKVVDIQNPTALNDNSDVRSSLFTGGGSSVEIADHSSGNTYAYVLGDNDIFVIDITTPLSVDNSSNIGDCTVGGRPKGIALSDDYLFVATIDNYFNVVDIHDPTNVTDASLVGQSGPSSYSAAASGEYAYVIGWYNGSYYLHVLYCLIPSSPSVLRTHDTTGFTYRVAIDDDYAYVADGGGLRVFGISAPGSSSEVASCSISGGIKSVAVHGPYAFVGGQSSGFSAVDISDPSAVDNDSVTTGLLSMYQAWDIKARGDLAFVADDQNGLIVVDISDPLNPLEVDRVLYGKECRDIALYGDYVYIAVGFEGGIKVLNIDRTSVDFLTTEAEYPVPPTYLWTNGVTARGEYVYMAVSSEGLGNIYMSSDFTTVSEQGTLATSDPQGLDMSGDYVFAADSTAGLKVIQVSDPAGPLLSGTCSTLSAWDVVVNGRYAYLVDGAWTAENNKFRIIDLIPVD